MALGEALGEGVRLPVGEVLLLGLCVRETVAQAEAESVALKLPLAQDEAL